MSERRFWTVLCIASGMLVLFGGSPFGQPLRRVQDSVFFTVLHSAQSVDDVILRAVQSQASLKMRIYELEQEKRRSEQKLLEYATLEQEYAALRSQYASESGTVSKLMPTRMLSFGGLSFVGVGSQERTFVGAFVLANGDAIGVLSDVLPFRSTVNMVHHPVDPILAIHERTGKQGVVSRQGGKTVLKFFSSTRVEKGDLVTSIQSISSGKRYPLGTIGDMVSGPAEPMTIVELLPRSNGDVFSVMVEVLR